MNENVITLPSREEMLERLLKVSNVSHVRQKFYPHLLKHAGQERVPQGVVMMLVLAISDYTTGLPSIVANQMYMQAPQFIEALVVDSKTAEEAKAFLKEALAA